MMIQNKKDRVRIWTTTEKEEQQLVYESLFWRDEGVHWGIQNGLCLSRSTIVYFKHNDMESLQSTPEKVTVENKRAKKLRRYIVVEAVYQNSGQIAPLDEIIRLKEKYHFRVLLDKSNSFGVLGSSERGIIEQYGVSIEKVDIITASMGHSLATEGGFCVGSIRVTAHQRLSSSGYVFSASLPPYLPTAAITAINVLEKNPNLIMKLNKNIAVLCQDLNHLKSQYQYPNLDALRATLWYRDRGWAELLNFKPTYRYSSRRKTRVIDFLLEPSPEPDPTLPQINLIPLTAEQEMAKKRAVRVLITKTSAPAVGDQTVVQQASQTQEAVIALPIARASSSRPSKRARTSVTEPRLVDEDDTELPQSTRPSPEPTRSDRAGPLEWLPKVTYKNQAITNTDSVVAEKDHSLAFNLAKSVCLPADMDYHNHLTELKAIRLATKSMVLALQKNHIAHKRVLELRKTAWLAMADANARIVELQVAKEKMTGLKSEVARLTRLVNSVEGDKQKALAELKDRYLRELAKHEKKKNAEIAELEKKMEDAEDCGYKEGEATYVLQCEAAKDIFFKCGGRQLS